MQWSIYLKVFQIHFKTTSRSSFNIVKDTVILADFQISYRGKNFGEKWLSFSQVAVVFTRLNFNQFYSTPTFSPNKLQYRNNFTNNFTVIMKYFTDFIFWYRCNSEISPNFLKRELLETLRTLCVSAKFQYQVRWIFGILRSVRTCQTSTMNFWSK